MASGAPMMNGDISRGPVVPTAPPTVGLEETLQQMNILIQENRDLKEALRQTNLSMKERFEGLSAWREKQKEERDFLESRLEEARGRMEALALQNQELREKLKEMEGGGGGGASSELEALHTQIARLQAEKNDLVAMNSELQLKTGQGSNDDSDSFIEIIHVESASAEGLKDPCGAERSAGGGPRLDMSMMMSSSSSRMESEEQTVSQLLQSLRKESQKVERLEVELQSLRKQTEKMEKMESQLQASQARIMELEEKNKVMESSTQTSLQPEKTPQGETGKEEKAASEVEDLKSQMMTLFKELQQAQSKLGEAEGMKKNLQDRCREVEQDVATLRAQLVDKQAIQTENERLKLQLDSMQAQSQLEQRKTAEERNNLAQLKDAYTKLFEDYNELKEEKKKRETQMAPKEALDDLQARLEAAEQALATKQEKIDAMKQEIFQKEKELETVSVFQAQAEVYSSDFYAERAAREKIHEEKERLAAQLEFIKKQNHQLQDEMESLGRQSLNEMQRRHVPRGGNPHGGAGAQGGRGDGREWQQQQANIPEHACPKCNEILPDLDSLQIHIMDCII